MCDKDYQQKVRLLELRIRELELLLAIEEKHPRAYAYPYPVYVQPSYIPIYYQQQTVPHWQSQGNFQVGGTTTSATFMNGTAAQ